MTFEQNKRKADPMLLIREVQVMQGKKCARIDIVFRDSTLDHYYAQ